MRIMGRPRALVAVVAGAFLLAGCGSGPTQVGAAAIVGDTTISLDKVQGLIDKAVSEQPYARKLASEHKLDELGRAIVSELVDEELLVQTARREGVVADQGQVAQALAKDPLSAPVPETADPSTGVAEVLARIFDHRDVLTKLNLQQQLANKMATKLEVTFDYFGVDPPQQNPDDPTAQPPSPAQLRSQAINIAHQIAADPAGATQAIANQAKQAKEKNVQPAGEANIKAALGDSPNFDATPLFWTPQNNVVVFPKPSDQSTGWFVAAIHSRSTDGVTGKHQPLAAEQLSGVSTRMVQEYARTANVKVNPRYGVWDVVSMSVALTPTADNTVVVPFGTPMPAGQ